PQAPPLVAMSTPSSRLHSEGGTARVGGCIGNTRPPDEASAWLIEATTASSWRISASEGAAACGLPTGAPSESTPALGSTTWGWGTGKPPAPPPPPEGAAGG